MSQEVLVKIKDDSFIFHFLIFLIKKSKSLEKREKQSPDSKKAVSKFVAFRMIMQVDWFLTRLTFNSWSITVHFVFALSNSLLDSVTTSGGTSAPHGPSHPLAFSGFGTSRIGGTSFILERIANAISSIIAESEPGFATDSTSC